ncbi:MAG: sugar transferase [Chitinophagales bacterium]|nr:sugar transferase [Chitinophagales bacterium]
MTFSTYSPHQKLKMNLTAQHQLFIKLLPYQDDTIKIYGIPKNNEDNATIIADYFIESLHLNQLYEYLNDIGKIKTITVFGYNPSMLYRIEKILNANNIKTQIVIHPKKNLTDIDFEQMTIKDIHLFKTFDSSPSIQDSNNYYFLNVSPNKDSSTLIKRMMDIFISFFLLITLLPIFLLISILIKINGSTSVFYKPIRVGIYGKKFKMYKFKSMYEDDLTGKKATLKDDPRITPIGRIIRKYNLDELPQLFNVLKGEMSLVGPRPHRVYLSEELQREIPNYGIRYLVKPGITGWAQANGWRGPTVTKEQKVQRTNHDLWYVSNCNPLFDIKIMIITVFGRKAYKNAF